MAPATIPPKNQPDGPRPLRFAGADRHWRGGSVRGGSARRSHATGFLCGVFAPVVHGHRCGLRAFFLPQESPATRRASGAGHGGPCPPPRGEYARTPGDCASSPSPRPRPSFLASVRARTVCPLARPPARASSPTGVRSAASLPADGRSAARHRRPVGTIRDRDPRGGRAVRRPSAAAELIAADGERRAGGTRLGQQGRRARREMTGGDNRRRPLQRRLERPRSAPSPVGFRRPPAPWSRHPPRSAAPPRRPGHWRPPEVQKRSPSDGRRERDSPAPPPSPPPGRDEQGPPASWHAAAVCAPTHQAGSPLRQADPPRRLRPPRPRSGTSPATSRRLSPPPRATMSNSGDRDHLRWPGQPAITVRTNRSALGEGASWDREGSGFHCGLRPWMLPALPSESNRPAHLTDPLVLGIESSCDDTRGRRSCGGRSIPVVRGRRPRAICHAPFGGRRCRRSPAARPMPEKVDLCIEAALAQAGR